ncbi:microsomal signal peptidase subunit SPC12 [Dacryopinax primogenitus]|uniref:Signal peptidase complex subunit 1 n=1 Tax=Dacryopinax primogenitus (strain DJM 731) TaxID=1858805 RepID=M5G389_DACPD|nr:microsomal signal peptidase subunit SPC12 [Dacryopinax primogenitus]EJT98212.1 microsomal signal peptidase subunit SPC12 [Dacryopinax primogenitus]
MDLLNTVERVVRRTLEGKIDFVAQTQVEIITYVVLSIATVVAFLAGYIAADLRISLAIFGVAVLGLLVLFVPPWPYLNLHPVPWRAPVAPSLEFSKAE